MSRIRFVWNIESEKIDRSDSEDQRAKRRRRRNLLRLQILVGLFLLALSLGALIVRQRLIDVQNEVAQLLQDTVKAEVAAIRIGDRQTFLQIQAGEDQAWLQRQNVLYQQYGDMKAAGRIELTGDILDVFIEDERARVLVQENIDGLPYSRLWFYRRDSRGWRHTATDLAFWGEQRQLKADGVIVNYRAVDERLAAQLAEAAAGWIDRGCGLLDCRNLPDLTAHIVNDAEAPVEWRDEGALQLRLRSPHLDIARADLPFDGALRMDVGGRLAARLVQAHAPDLRATYPYDSYFLYNAAVSWLTEYMTRIPGGSDLIRSLADNFGVDKVPLLLSGLSNAGDMSSILRVDSSIDIYRLDWRDFVEWRLRAESELLAASAQDLWLSLYDTGSESLRLLAYERYSQRQLGMQYRVIDTALQPTDDGAPQLLASVDVSHGGQSELQTIAFNLVGDVWKRAS